MRNVRIVLTVTLLLMLTALLAACGGTTVAPTTADSPTSVSSANDPTPAPTRPAASATATARPTSMPRPTSTEAPTEEPTEAPTEEPTEAPTAAPAPPAGGGGGSLARGALENRPYVVMIDNHADAYPQSGLNSAALVMEALAEYGVTRFMAFFTDAAEVEVIGPIRSARIYFIRWAMPYLAIFNHAGGSPDALEYLAGSQELVNLEQEIYQGVYSWRSNQRLAPHNLYSSTELMRDFRDTNFAPVPLPEAGYLFRDPAPGDITVSSFGYYFLSPDLPISWSYDAASNRYWRNQWGGTHIDGLTGEQLNARSVIVMEVESQGRVGDPKSRIDQDVTGSGRARLFVEGRTQPLTWEKPDNMSHLRFYDANGAEVRFPPGRIWIAVLPTLSTLWY